MFGVLLIGSWVIPLVCETPIESVRQCPAVVFSWIINQRGYNLGERGSRWYPGVIPRDKEVKRVVWISQGVAELCCSMQMILYAYLRLGFSILPISEFAGGLDWSDATLLALPRFLRSFDAICSAGGTRSVRCFIELITDTILTRRLV